MCRFCCLQFKKLSLSLILGIMFSKSFPQEVKFGCWQNGKKKQANKQTKPILLSFLVALTLGHVPQIDFVKFWMFGWKRTLSNENSSLQWLPLHVILPPSLQSGVFYPNIIVSVVAGLKTYKELEKDLDGQRLRLKQRGRRTARSQVTSSQLLLFFQFTSSLLCLISSFCQTVFL